MPNPPFLPNVQIQETIQPAAAPLIQPLTACVVGPNARTTRYEAPSERAAGKLGAYNPLANTTYPWPGLAATDVVDLSYPGLGVWCENAKLAFFTHAAGSGPAIAPVANQPNRVSVTGGLGFASVPGSARLAALYNRDVQIGDRVRLAGTVSDVNYLLDTYVTGLIGAPVASAVGTAAPASTNAATQTGSATVTQIDGAINCATLAADGTNYDGLATGAINETYTVTVTQGSVGSDPTTALISLSSASGGDNAAPMAPSAYGTPFTIGARGLSLTFSDSAGTCGLVAGQTWRVVVAQAFTASAANAGGAYAGAANDTYIVTVARGGMFDALPENQPTWTVTTAKGLDAGGPTTITSAGTAVPIGTQGVTLALSGGVRAQAAATVSGGEITDVTVTVPGTTYTAAPTIAVVGGGGSGAALTATVSGGAVTGVTITTAGSGYTSAPTLLFTAPSGTIALRAGDRFYVPVTAASTGAVTTLALADPVPSGLSAVSDLNVWLYAEQTVPLDQETAGSNPLLNWSAAGGGVTVNGGARMFLPPFVDGNNLPLPLTLIDGTLYANYRAWTPALAGGVTFLTNTAQLASSVPGPTDPDNPLGFALSMALANAAGASVACVAVAAPDDVASWQTALALLTGRTDVYNIVPLTTSAPALAQAQAFVDAQSGPEAGRRCALFVGVAPSAALPRVSAATSSDGQPALATLAAPSEAPSSYTRLTITSGNVGLLAAGVQPGDVARFFFTTTYGRQSYQSFPIAQVTSQTSLTLATSGGAAAPQPQLVEIWHTQTANDAVQDLISQAAAFSDTRVCAVWSDLLGPFAAQSLAPYHVAAAVAGLRSGALPQLSLTNQPVLGLDGHAAPVGALNGAQLGTLCANGVWVVSRAGGATGGPIVTRLATTTLPGSPMNVATREEMVRANVDSIVQYLQADLNQYLTGMNMVQTALTMIYTQVEAALKYLQVRGATVSLGGQLVDYTILSIAPHAVLVDTLVIGLNLTVPSPINQIDVNVNVVVGSNVAAGAPVASLTSPAA